MLRGDLPAVAHAALTGGRVARPVPARGRTRPVGPMLAQTATSVADALERLGGEAAFEAKLDGARVQIHRDGDDVVDLHPQPRRRHRPAARGRRRGARAAGARRSSPTARRSRCSPDGRPHPFQVTASRFGTQHRSPDRLPLSAFLFDVLHVDGADLLDAADRRTARRARPHRPAPSSASTGWSPPIPRPRRSSSTARSPPATKA